MDTKVGKISSALIQGNWGGAIGAAIEGTGFEQGLAAFGAQIDAAGLSGVLGMSRELLPQWQIFLDWINFLELTLWSVVV